ncbi:AraC family transcriptional regulator [Stutzerimonas stutzeri]|uniref:AraC family transcriptional regulator n=1 Tax=Stutzerimonas stutzeri TaxID=316 RepID=UPI0031CE06E9
MDRLSSLLCHFGMHAGLYHSGALCGVAAFETADQVGYIHVLRQGSMTLRLEDNSEVRLTEPTVMVFPRPYRHRMLADEAEGARLVCATLRFDGGINNPLAAALPDVLLLPVAEAPILDGALAWLFDEAFASYCGREAVMGRLFELLMVQMLRHLMASQTMSSGMMAGLADLRLARAITLMHAEPERAWSVAELAAESNMSRASFAASFRAVVGQTPADYLTSWRISLAQKRLREGRPIALIADEVGYESPSALARAFRRKTGASPREWQAALTA